MLVNLRIENFKSFDHPADFSMISSSKIRNLPDHKVNIKQTNILKHAIIFGANASGKSNFVSFFIFFKECLASGLQLKYANSFCKNRIDNKKKESCFEIQFSIQNNFYVYGFKAVLSEMKITEEYLYLLYQNGSSDCIFERSSENVIELGSKIKLSGAEKRNFETYIYDFKAGSPNLLFISEMNRNKRYEPDSKLLVFQSVFRWLMDNIVIITPQTTLSNTSSYYDDNSLNEISKLIQTFDTGISQVEIREITIDELRKELSEEELRQLYRQMEIAESEHPGVGKRFTTVRTDKSIYSLEITDNEARILDLKIKMLTFKHGDSPFDFLFEDESDGTRRLLDLLDILLNKYDDTLYIVDELDRSMHPKLTYHFLELFLRYHKNDQVQLIATTHESTVMDQNLFRRDEIWFTERTIENSSIMYSLDRFEDRKDRVLAKAYLEGRYGALPILTQFSDDDSEEDK